MWTKVKTFLHVVLALAVGEVEKVAAGIWDEIPLADLLLRALVYGVALAFAFGHFVGLWQAVGLAALAAPIVLALNFVLALIKFPAD